MTALPGDWLLSIRPQREQITAEDYERLPEEICRAIEIVDGRIVYYKHVGTFMKNEPGSLPTVANPLPITIDWQDLEY